MGKLFTAMRKAPKRMSALFAMFAVMAIVPAAVLAWGPSRETYTVEKPADHVVFNSITNNPVIGDERNFVNIKDAASTTDGGWQDNIKIVPGKKYQVRVYVHNNAAANLNLKATNTRVSASVPTTTAKSVSISGFVSADNANPGKVWDDVTFTSDQDFNLAYVPGSARIYNNGYAKGGNGQALPDSIVTSAGAKIGHNGPDGVVPGCFQYDNYVYFEVQPQVAAKPDFTMSKQVRKTGSTTWSKSVTANPGDSVEYLISYKNTGEVKQDNVIVKDVLPKGVSYVNGTTKLKNGLNPNGKTLTDEVTKSGVNISNYNPAAAGYVWFTGKIGSKTELECGTQKLINKGIVETDHGTKEDTAEVVVKNDECKPKECKPGIPVGDKRCETTKEYCTVPGKEDLPKDSPLCKEDKEYCTVEGKEDLPKDSPLCVETPPETPETPVTPSELPTTGPAETLLSVIGLGALIASASYYVVSRRALLGR